MDTEQMQKDSEESSTFSDLATVSRELQDEGFSITEDDVEIEKKMVFDSRGEKIQLGTDDKETFDPSSETITEKDIRRTLESDKNDIISERLRGYWRNIKILEYKDVEGRSNYDTFGIIREENGSKFVYPCNLKYVLRVDPEDPIVDHEYCVKSQDKRTIEKIKKRITDSTESRITSSGDKIELQTETEISQDMKISSTRFNIGISALWFVSACITFAGGNADLIAFMQLATACLWGLYASFDSKLNKKQTSSKSTKLSKYDMNENPDVESLLDSYINDKTTNEVVEFSVGNSGQKIVAEAQGTGTKWTLSENGVVPEEVVDSLVNIGFDNIKSPVYSMDVKPVEGVDNPSRTMVSDCGDWYLDLSSTESVSN